MKKLFAIYACKNQLGKPENEQLCFIKSNLNMHHVKHESTDEVYLPAIFKTMLEATCYEHGNGIDLLQSVYPSKYTCPSGRLYVQEINI